MRGKILALPEHASGDAEIIGQKTGSTHICCCVMNVGSIWNAKGQATATSNPPLTQTSLAVNFCAFHKSKEEAKKKNLEPRVVNLIIVELCGRECVSFAISISADPWYALVFSSCASFPVHSVSMLIVLVLARPKKGEERKKNSLLACELIQNKVALLWGSVFYFILFHNFTFRLPFATIIIFIIVSRGALRMGRAFGGSRYKLQLYSYGSWRLLCYSFAVMCAFFVAALLRVVSFDGSEHFASWGIFFDFTIWMLWTIMECWSSWI